MSNRKPIPDFPGYYISSDGKVWSKHRRLTDGSKRIKTRELVSAPSSAGTGYLLVSLVRDGG